MVRQIACGVPECSSGGTLPNGQIQVGPYLTDYECETRAEHVVDLRDHAKDVHEFAENAARSESKEAIEK